MTVAKRKDRTISQLLALMLLGLMVLWALPAVAQEQVKVAWVRRYDGPTSRNDEPSAIAVDASGNVYVTGYSYATIKYDTDGNELWVRRYDWPGVYRDEASAIAVDAGGNVYVTGESYGDYVMIKYDTDGNELWVQRYNGPASGYDEAEALAVDASGNVYVTGAVRRTTPLSSMTLMGTSCG